MSHETALVVFAQRLEAFQLWLETENIDAFWLPSADAHLNEYLPEAWKRRDWLCGFTGSAGDLLVSPKQAWLFADSRYHEQAGQQVPTHKVAVVKLGLEKEPTLKEVLESLLKVQTQTFTLALDAETQSAAAVESLKKGLETQTHFKIKGLGENPVDALRLKWEALQEASAQKQTEATQAKPWPPTAEIYFLPPHYTGRTAQEKLTLVREALQQQEAAFYPISKLDEVAWLFNLRGSDIEYNPVFLAYALVLPESVYLFCDAHRLSPEASEALAEAHVVCLPYKQFWSCFSDLLKEKPAPVLWSDNSHTWGLLQALKAHPAEEKLGCGLLKKMFVSPIAGLKAVKTTQELAAMRSANWHSSRAKCRLLAWIERETQAGKPLTEADLVEQLQSYYQQEEGFLGLSFNTIAGGGSASSIVHYSSINAERLLQQDDWILIDSGAHYWGGTTDDTRSTVLGKTPTLRQQQAYTGVLKAHIAAAKACFPKGTTGVEIDALTRAPLWQLGLDYGHGTGHGVGAHLNVHEGPNGIHKRATTPFAPGQINSIEPGYYDPGWGGIRLENLVEVVALEPAKRLCAEGEVDFRAQLQGTANEKTWYTFSPLTLIPFEGKLILWAWLTHEERQWLQSYYQLIAERLVPELDKDTAAWVTAQLACTAQSTP